MKDSPCNNLFYCNIKYLFDSIRQVHVTDFYKPNFEEFQERAVPIYKGNNKLFIQNNKYYDSWYYLSVLPNSKMVRKRDIFSFILPCVQRK